MRSREQVISDFVHSWLRRAELDLGVAERLLGGQGHYGDAVGFHCQRAAERFMKAYLVRHQIEFLKVHDLAVLRGLIGKKDLRLAEILAFADWLTPLGVEGPDPGEFPEVDRNTAEKALSDSREVRRLVLESLPEYLDQGRPGA